MRRLLPLLAGLLVTAACTGGGSGDLTPSRGPTATHPTATHPTATSSSPATPSVTVAPTAAPSLPPGVPPTYAGDVPSGDVPLKALVPKGTMVEGSWYATTTAGEAIVVAYARPGEDPFHAERGFVVWRRFPESPPWRALYAVVHHADEGVVSTQALTADLTGDGSPDALVNEITGGSGACGTWRVVDLSGGTEIWRRDLCDAQVVPSSDPVGIRITEAVFKPGDAHCCPSAMRTTVLTYAGDGRWTVASKVVTPTGT